jgi:hypothetical protein
MSDAPLSTIDQCHKVTQDLFDQDLTKLKHKLDEENSQIERTAMDAEETETEQIMRMPEVYEKIYGARLQQG